MRKPFAIHLLVQFAVLVAAAAMAFIPAVTIMGGIGGAAMGVAPEFTFGMFEGLICPDGTLEYYSIQRSYHRPGESEPHVECIRNDGVREDVLIPAIFSVLGATFLGAFGGLLLLIFTPLAVLAFVITRRLISSQGAP